MAPGTDRITTCTTSPDQILAMQVGGNVGFEMPFLVNIIVFS